MKYNLKRDLKGCATLLQVENILSAVTIRLLGFPIGRMLIYHHLQKRWNPKWYLQAFIPFSYGSAYQSFPPSIRV